MPQVRANTWPQAVTGPVCFKCQCDVERAKRHDDEELSQVGKADGR